MHRSLLLLVACTALACSSSSSGGAPSTNDHDASTDATDAVPDTRSEAATDAAPSEKILGPYESYAACTDFRMTHPFAGEEKDWAALRLSPPDKSRPFTVTELQYWMVSDAIPGGGVCHAALAHRVKLVTAKSAAPPATPTSAREIAVPATTATSRREISLRLEEPFVVPAGEDLVIAIQMAGTWPDVSCLVACGAKSVDSDRNYWGTGDAPPHTWKTMASLGLDGDYLIVAYGHE